MGLRNTFDHVLKQRATLQESTDDVKRDGDAWDLTCRDVQHQGVPLDGVIN